MLVASEAEPRPVGVGKQRVGRDVRDAVIAQRARQGVAIGLVVLAAAVEEEHQQRRAQRPGPAADLDQRRDGGPGPAEAGVRVRPAAPRHDAGRAAQRRQRQARQVGAPLEASGRRPHDRPAYVGQVEVAVEEVELVRVAAGDDVASR